MDSFDLKEFLKTADVKREKQQAIDHQSRTITLSRNQLSALWAGVIVSFIGIIIASQALMIQRDIRDTIKGQYEDATVVVHRYESGE